MPDTSSGSEVPYNEDFYARQQANSRLATEALGAERDRLTDLTYPELYMPHVVDAHARRVRPSLAARVVRRVKRATTRRRR